MKCLQEMLGRYDTTLKKMFAWYASLPSLAGPVSWEQFRNNHKGMLSGHLLLLLTDFKVTSTLCCPCTTRQFRCRQSVVCYTHAIPLACNRSQAYLSQAHLHCQASHHLANCLHETLCITLCIVQQLTRAQRALTSLHQWSWVMLGDAGCTWHAICQADNRLASAIQCCVPITGWGAAVPPSAGHAVPLCTTS